MFADSLAARPPEVLGSLDSTTRAFAAGLFQAYTYGPFTGKSFL
jgi:hypothetical protein